jgi:predicted RNase H-like nuclease (RuvC/YqgF family)
MSKVPEKQKSNPILSGLINMFFDMIKHFMKDFENIRKVKKIDNMSDKFSSLEHMMVRLEDKLQDNRHQIEELKNRLLWGNIFIIILVLFVIYQLIVN